MGAVTLGAVGQIDPRGPFVFAVFARPHWNAMPPPQLAADAPVLDVLPIHPVEVHFLETLWNDLDLSVLHCHIRFFGQRLNLHVPLCRDHRLPYFSPALRPWNGGGIRVPA